MFITNFNYRLELELQDLREQLSENKNLNSTLKLELDMYEQLEMKTKGMIYFLNIKFSY